MSSMSYREESRERRGIQFRIVMDIVMGLIYTAIGILLLATRAFVGVPLPAIAAYIIGAMLAVGGSARLYRGLKVVLPKKRGSNTSASE
jgi:hypothetical protein